MASQVERASRGLTERRAALNSSRAGCRSAGMGGRSWPTDCDPLWRRNRRAGEGSFHGALGVGVLGERVSEPLLVLPSAPSHQSAHEECWNAAEQSAGRDLVVDRVPRAGA